MRLLVGMVGLSGARGLETSVSSCSGSGWLYPLLIAVLFYLVVMRGGSTSWSSYYLFWFIGPAVAALLLAHPAILLLVPVALVARRWVPDPWLAVKYAGRVRSIDADVRANPDNITARRNLAVIWLEKRRPQRALPLLEQALRRDPEDIELHHVRGLALLGTRRWEASVDELLEVLRRQPRFRYGEAYLRASDALIALHRWEQAEDGLTNYVEVNRSSVEGRYKLGLVRAARGDSAGATEALRQARDVYRDSPPFHRRKQLGWYLRARLRALLTRQ